MKGARRDGFAEMIFVVASTPFVLLHRAGNVTAERYEYHFYSSKNKGKACIRFLGRVSRSGRCSAISLPVTTSSTGSSAWESTGAGGGSWWTGSVGRKVVRYWTSPPERGTLRWRWLQ